MELTWILQTITTLVIGIIAFFLKGTLSEFKESLKQNAGDIKKVKDELNDLKSDLPFVYVLREDFIRTLNNVDAKMCNIDGKIDKLLEIKNKGD